MIIDKRLQFASNIDANGPTIAVVFGDVVDTNDLGTSGQDLGGGEPIYLVVRVATAYSAAGTSVKLDFRSSTLAALTGGTTTTHLTTEAVSTASGIAAGTQWIWPLPSGVYQRYIGMFVTTVGAVAAGKVDAFLTKDPSRWRTYNDAIPANQVV